MHKFIQEIPKTELHLHIEGTLEPELMFALAERNKISLPYQTMEEVKQAYNFHNLQSFLDIYDKATQVLVQEQDFYDLTWAYLTKVNEQNVRHVEIFFDAQTHTHRGVDFDIVVNGIHHALQDAENKLNITSRLILGILRDFSEEDAIATLQQTLLHKDKIYGIGLNSAEVGNPPEKFAKAYQLARENGLAVVAHAGEEGPPEYIWQALDVLKVQRIEHGIRCIEDEILVERLVQEQIPLTVCPLSNVKLCAVDSLENHPIKKMLQLGLCVTMNSDDPAYFGGYILENYLQCQQALDLSKQDIYQLAKNGINASFIIAKRKQELLSKLEMVGNN